MSRTLYKVLHVNDGFCRIVYVRKDAPFTLFLFQDEANCGGIKAYQCSPEYETERELFFKPEAYLKIDLPTGLSQLEIKIKEFILQGRSKCSSK